MEASLAGFARGTQLDHAGLRVDLVTVEPGKEPQHLAADENPGRRRLVSTTAFRAQRLKICSRPRIESMYGWVDTRIPIVSTEVIPWK